MKKLLTISLLFTAVYAFGQVQPTTKPATKYPEPEKMTPGMTEIWDPEVKIIQPGITNSDAPSDAIVLFNGSDISAEWTDMQGNPSKWIVKDGALVSVRGAGYIKSKRKFANFQLHIEWKTPSEVTGESQGRGNSGVFLQELYEVQVLDSYNNRTYRNGQAGSLYKQYASAGECLQENRVNGRHMILFIQLPLLAMIHTIYVTPPRVTVLHNGVLVQNNVSLKRTN